MVQLEFRGGNTVPKKTLFYDECIIDRINGICISMDVIINIEVAQLVFTYDHGKLPCDVIDSDRIDSCNYNHSGKVIRGDKYLLV